MLNKDSTLSSQASLQRCLRKLNKKPFNENRYDKLYPSGSAPCIYCTPKMHKFSSSDTFNKLCPIVLCIETFNCVLTRFLCDLLSPILFLLFLKLRRQIFPVNVLFSAM